MEIISNLKTKINSNSLKVSIIGLGYVGLPVAYHFSKKFKVIGFDKNTNRILSLKKKIDFNNSLSKKELKTNKITFSSNLKDICSSDVFILTLPTPINKNKKPELKFIYQALNSLIGLGIKNKIIILESTVFPGASESLFIKYLERKTKLKINLDFFYGYSPERINPGDKKNKFDNISKIVSGSSKEILNILYLLYKKVVKKVFKSSSILTAETAKLIENSQRDLNVSFVNEIAIICNKFKIKSNEALELASTKWNFLNFKPGLVGGHCIGVDPYYLFYSANKIGYKPKTLLAGRNLNEKFSKFLVGSFLSNFPKKKLKLLLMGATYKANCNDLRNSKSFEVYKELLKKKCIVDFYEPNISISTHKKIKFIKRPKKNNYDGILILVDHLIFKKMGIEKISSYGKNDCKILDLKNIFNKRDNILHL